MRALKIAGAAIAAVIVVIVLLLMIGIPSGFMTQAIQERVERETGYRLVVSGASRLGIWPSLNVTLNDIVVQDPKARDSENRLTIGSVQAELATAKRAVGQSANQRTRHQQAGSVCPAAARARCAHR